MGDPVRTDQPNRGLAIELREAHDMRATGDRGHRRNISERAAERQRPQQDRVRHIKSDASRDINGVSRDRLLIVQDQFRSTRGARGRECQAGLLAGRLIPARLGCGTFERPHR